MEVKINDDIQTFGTSISSRGWVCGVLGGFVGMLTYFGIGRTLMPPSFEGIPTMVISTPFLLVGFCRVHTMPFEVWLKNMLNTIFFRRGRRLYRSENIYAVFTQKDMMQRVAVKEPQPDKKTRRKKC